MRPLSILDARAVQPEAVTDYIAVTERPARLAREWAIEPPLTLEETVIRVARGGTYRVAVRWSPYWHASTGCLTRADGGMLQLRTGGPARVRIGFDVDATSLFNALDGTAPTCSQPPGPSK